VAALMFCIKARLLEAAEKLKAEGTGEGMYGLQPVHQPSKSSGLKALSGPDVYGTAESRAL
jgi:hypothetical protein